MENLRIQKDENSIAEKVTDPNVLRAVYALNMCTVSVSQIIDYNDVYILEQEYDAILNNLNLEKMPKAEALKNILIELLNTITFFRIQELRKESIEKKYQQQMKNAIWSAIPNMNMIVAGNPVAIACSLATQVGIGYMNYRKEKNSILNAKEREELELRITAIEQFHALRRELFTTAWELAEEYDFDDKLRLTEKQIRQYNQILMDQDELRKYVRLEAIQDRFEAFPAFWYFFGHTACSIAANMELPLENWEREEYRRRAKEHFSYYEKLNTFNILREDQMTAACSLEYIDLLLLEENTNKSQIVSLLKTATEMAGNAFDVKQLCAMTYLKIGDTDNAAILLKQLVNEGYNTTTNAKLLSRIYVSQFLEGNSRTARYDYKMLLLMIGEDKSNYIFPMPDKGIKDCILQKWYLDKQKIILQEDYRRTINEFVRKYTVLFNAVIPAPYGYDKKEDYYGCREEAFINRFRDIEKILKTESKDEFLYNLAHSDFRYKYIDLLNQVMETCDELELWKESEEHDLYTLSVRGKIVQMRHFLKNIQENINNARFNIEDYKSLQQKLSFKAFMETMIDGLKNTVMDAIDDMDSMEQVEKAECNLMMFCDKQGLLIENNKKSEDSNKVQRYIEYDVLGSEGRDEKKRKERIEKMCNLVERAQKDLIITHTKEATILLRGSEKFHLYFKNDKLKTGALKEKTIAIIDDDTKKDCDFVITESGVLLIKKNKEMDLHEYKNVKYNKSGKHGEMLVFKDSDGYIDKDEYINTNIDIARLYKLLKELEDISIEA